MDPTTSPAWGTSDLLDVQVDHVIREAGPDGLFGSVGLPGGIDAASAATWATGWPAWMRIASQ